MRGHRLAPAEIVELVPPDAARIHRAALDLVEQGGDPIDHAAELVTLLPAAVVVALHRYRSTGSPNNTMLVRGLLPEWAGLPPTPATTTPAPERVVEAAALALLAVTSVLGEAFTFANLYQGRLVQHIVPVRGRETAQTSEGSESLDWHVEDAFHEDRCDYFGLLCLRGHLGASTLVAPARNLVLDHRVVAVLRQPRFVVAPDLAHGLPEPSAVEAVPVLSGDPDDPEICYDAIYQRPADLADRAAVDALAALALAIDVAAVGHELAPGEALLADNRRVVHGRTRFRPRYDGADRWLLRVMACASVRAHRRRRALRTIA
ncbi:TauD/TfdA family dioxygenase [Nocardia sp. NPDC057440]|uniref:TauD/TfdA family dioxygenase n=1 Tax=Nocardia sp. NPDC057440 TaxID=3346134 RepID=UPI00366C12D1